MPRFLGSALSRLQTSKPSMPGIMISSSISAGLAFPDRQRILAAVRHQQLVTAPVQGLIEHLQVGGIVVHPQQARRLDGIRGFHKAVLRSWALGLGARYRILGIGVEPSCAPGTRIQFTF